MEAAFYTTREFWVAVAFVIFVVALFRPIRRALVTALDGRAAKIRSEIEEAAKLREEARALLNAYQRKQREAIKEAGDIVAQARKEADALRRKGAEELEASIGRREKMAMDRITQAEAEALAQVRNAAVDVAAAATRQLIAQNLDAAKSAGLIDAALTELPARFH